MFPARLLLLALTASDQHRDPCVQHARRHRYDRDEPVVPASLLFLDAEIQPDEHGEQIERHVKLHEKANVNETALRTRRGCCTSHRNIPDVVFQQQVRVGVAQEERAETAESARSVVEPVDDEQRRPAVPGCDPAEMRHEHRRRAANEAEVKKVHGEDEQASAWINARTLRQTTITSNGVRIRVHSTLLTRTQNVAEYPRNIQQRPQSSSRPAARFRLVRREGGDHETHAVHGEGEADELEEERAALPRAHCGHEQTWNESLASFARVESCPVTVPRFEQSGPEIVDRDYELTHELAAVEESQRVVQDLQVVHQLQAVFRFVAALRPLRSQSVVQLLGVPVRRARDS